MSLRLCAIVLLRPELDDATRAGLREALLQSGEALEGIVSSHAEFDLPGCTGGGGLTWDFSMRDRKALDALEKRFDSAPKGTLARALTSDRPDLTAAIERIDAAILETIVCEARWDGFDAHPGSIKRTNFVRVQENAPSAQFLRWLRDVPRLAEHVPAIKNWSLSRVRGFLGEAPPVEWTHCWEQEFASAEALHGDYMLSPYHWGYLDGYYDLENPRCIMDARLTHIFCRARHGVLCDTGNS